MKRLRVAIALLVVILATGIWGHFLIENACKEMAEIVKYDCAITVQERKTSEKRAEQLQEEWSKKEKIFAVILPHSELDEIEISLKKLTDFHSQNMTEEYIKALNECSNRFEHIAESERLTFQNIF